MRVFALAAGALAALTLGGGAPARAADLGYGYEAPDRYKSAYEDSRYRDIFGPPPSHTARPYAEDRYAADDDDRVYREREVYDEKRVVTRRHYRYAEPAAPNCAPRAEIRDRLFSQGWHEFRELDVHQRVAIVEARRPNGLPYRLAIDRCSGDVVSADPLIGGPHAFGPRRHGPPLFR